MPLKSLNVVDNCFSKRFLCIGRSLDFEFFSKRSMSFGPLNFGCTVEPLINWVLYFFCCRYRRPPLPCRFRFSLSSKRCGKVLPKRRVDQNSALYAFAAFRSARPAYRIWCHWNHRQQTAVREDGTGAVPYGILFPGTGTARRISPNTSVWPHCAYNHGIG